jgi:hypothetical protein
MDTEMKPRISKERFYCITVYRDTAVELTLHLTTKAAAVKVWKSILCGTARHENQWTHMVMQRVDRVVETLEVDSLTFLKGEKK